jgi:hypothetical protein
MAAMKVTTSAAMRARDVSRPRPEHLAEAELAEASAAAGSRARIGEAVNQVRGGDKAKTPQTPQTPQPPQQPRPQPPSAADAERAGRPRFPRRRRGRGSR